MSNNYFQFKQFKVTQDKCAMKVTTDACILGAWTPIPIPILPTTQYVLDIGTGTGLLSLMLAQRNEYIKIDSIEIDGVAANQAKENIAATIWASNINTIVGDARHLTAIHKYDLIITNPPFFKNSLQSPTVNKNLARHSNTLSNTDLLNIANTHITETGYFAILLPLPEYLLFETFFITNGWYLVKKISIKHTQNALVKRVIGLFTRIPNRQAEEELLIIYNEDKTYTTHFKDLMSPFYLNL